MSFKSFRGVKVRRHSSTTIASAVRVASEPLEQRTLLSSMIFTVTVATDGVAPVPAGSLRQAILDANANLGTDTIKFAIGSGPATISPTTDLPLITDPVIIDGTTQPGFTSAPIIDLDGSSDIGTVYGLEIDTGGGGSTIRGLVINNFEKVGIIVRASANNIIAGNYIGTDLTGTMDEGNLNEGIFITESSGNRVGGTTAADLNVISGNDQEGINIAGVFVPAVLDPMTMAVITPSSFTDATDNIVEGNYIGTDVTGTLPLGNTLEGITISMASSNTIGGTAAGAGNVISANGNDGIGILTDAANGESGASANVIAGNMIGTDLTGTIDTNLGNTDDGIHIVAGHDNVIGKAGGPNVISGNGGNGIEIDADVSDTDNLSSANSNTIENNFIGTNAAGTGALGNTGDGIHMVGGVTNQIGGAGASARNIISGNGGDGINLLEAAPTLFGSVLTDDSNTFQNNYIGTNAAGTAALANTGTGITIFGGFKNLIGGSSAGLGNLISGNGSSGIYLESTDVIFVSISTNTTTVQNNLIGVNASGSAALANGADGVDIGGATNTTIGGSSAADRNVISGNTGAGIDIAIFSTSTSIQGNYIGTNSAGTIAIPNTGDGVKAVGDITSMSALSIGGSASGEGNIISGNGGAGISIDGDQGDFIEGNWIGTNSAGTNLGNTKEGISITNSIAVIVGGTLTGQANVIAFNKGVGVALPGDSTSASRGNSIRRNSIYSNGSLGIDLSEDGVTANDNGDLDADMGPNGLQNFPVLTTVVTNGGFTNIQGTLDSNADTTFDFELFSNNSADAGGQGRQYLYTVAETSGNTGTTGFNVTIPVVLTAGQFITATATNETTGDTSEFSAGLVTTIVTPPPTKPGISINDVSMTEGNGGQKNFTFTVKLSKMSASDTSVFYATANGSAMSPGDYVAVPLTKLTFTAGQTSKTITVKVNGDTAVEGDETFFVNLSSPTNGTITDSQGKGTIQNDDVAPPSGTVSVVTDPCDSSKTALKFVGTSGNDTIVVTNASANVQGKSIVTINGVNKGTFSFTGRILGYGGNGNDKITIDSHITRTAQIYGEAGNDTINGGSGNDLLFGGDGNDQLNGNAGRDILLGQLNNDLLNGGTGDDILIAGSTTYDNNTEAWCDIQQEWFRTDLPNSTTYTTRVNHLINGGGKNGQFTLNPSHVFSSPQQPDTLTGGADNDLFYSATSGDKITDKASAEKMVTVKSS